MAQSREERNRKKTAKRNADREAFRTEARAYYHANREKINANTNKHRAENYESWRESYEKYRNENIENIAETNRKWREANADAIKAKKKEYYKKNKERLLAKSKAYRKANPEKVAAAKKKCYLAKRDEYLEKGRAANAGNKDAVAIRSKAYRENLDPEIRKKRARDYARKRRYSDPLYALKSLCRSRIGHALRGGGWTDVGSSRELLGCSYPELKSHLETQFLPGMTWANRGAKGWHVDHIQPLALAETEEDIKRLLHYTNLRPLWGKDNLKKASKLPCGKLVRKKSVRKIP